jgi:hypothetical protein
MNDLDDRLRTTLGQLAGTVPPSTHPRADLERRLARRGRRPMLVAVAAAVAVAALVVSVALSQSGDPAPRRVATPPPEVFTGGGGRTTYTLPNGDLAGPVELGRFEYERDTLVAMLSVVAMNDGEHWNIRVYGPVDNTFPFGASYVVPTWPTKDPPGRVVETYPVLGEEGMDSGPLPQLKLFVTSPQVTTLVVRRADGQPVTVNQVATTPGANFYLADFAGSTEGFGYTAKDAAGNLLEEAIT